MRTVRIGAGQGFYGDTPAGALAVAERGDVSYICCDALAELTMAILMRDRMRDPDLGYTRDLVDFMRVLLPVCREKRIRIITNAGGMNPPGAARAVCMAAREIGWTDLRVAAVTGDDVAAHLDALMATQGMDHLDTGESFSTVRDRVLFANAYLGAEPIVDALRQEVDVVITGRVADASLFLAPMVHELDWAFDAWDKLASGIVVGHLLECSAQSTGGNFGGNWRSIDGMGHIGYPVAEVADDGTATLTKPPATGGRVSFDTVRQQLLYEVHDPRSYRSPDVVADFTTVSLDDEGGDRVRVTGVHGSQRPDTLKVICGYTNGFLGTASISYAWPDAYQKAQRAADLVLTIASHNGLQPIETHVEYFGVNAAHGTAASMPSDINEAGVRVAARFQDEKSATRFARLATPLALNGPPFISGGAAPERGRPLLGAWPALIPRDAVTPVVSVVTAGDR